MTSIYRRAVLLLLVAAGLGVCFDGTAAQPSAPGVALSCGEMETFLKTATIERQRRIPVGVTDPVRATLKSGTLRHDAAIQTTDITRATFATSRGMELNFRDSWKFNVAGYEVAKLLELNMVPPYVERTVAGTAASVSWWVNDAMMERDRLHRKISPPDPVEWNSQMYAVRLFHDLIGDTDFNATNILITGDWRVWMIDFSRAFRRTTTIHHADRLKHVDRRLLSRLRQLTRETLRQKTRRWLTTPEIEALLARRALIVGMIEKEIGASGEAAVFYELGRAAEPCGAGLD